MTRRLSVLVLLLLAVACFTLAVFIQPRAERLSQRSDEQNVLKVLLGDGRKLFANHFFVQADVYFHNGYYPGIFDQAQAPKDSRHMTAPSHEHEGEQSAGTDHTEDEEHSAAREGEGHEPGEDSTPEASQRHSEDEHYKAMAFLGPPRDWIERFGRNFIISEHTHLAGSKEKEILPWLRISAELDPHRIDTYTVASFWLRKEMGKPQEAEKFLREGIRNNPNSHELLLELGRVYAENYQDPNRARNVWELALRRWLEHQGDAQQPDLLSFEQITLNLARVEEASGNLAAAIGYLEMASKASPHPEVLQKQIADLRSKQPPP